MLATCQKVIWIRDHQISWFDNVREMRIRRSTIPTMYRALSLRAFSYRQVLWFQPCFGSLSTINRKNRRRLWQCNTNIILKNLARLISRCRRFFCSFLGDSFFVRLYSCKSRLMIDRKLTWLITSFLRHGFLSRATLLAPSTRHECLFPTPPHSTNPPTHPPPKSLSSGLLQEILL